MFNCQFLITIVIGLQELFFFRFCSNSKMHFPNGREMHKEIKKFLPSVIEMLN